MEKYIIIIILYLILKIKSNNTFTEKIINNKNLKRNISTNTKNKINSRIYINNIPNKPQIYTKFRILNEKADSSIIKISNNISDNIKNSNKIKKNLLIGAIVNLNWETVAPFFKSFEQARFENCECVMFVGKMSQITINKIKSCGVKVLPIPNYFISLNIRINNYRWKIYEDFLNDNKNKYNLVFTADVRDTFFQTDIFKKYENLKPFLGIAIENNILTQIINKNWLIDIYGLELYETIKNKKIICSGTVWGTYDIFREFSRIMWEKIASKWSKLLKVIDQAVMNYLIYHEKLFNDCLIKSEAKDGPVMTMYFLNDKDIILDLDDNVINNKSEKISIIHQYDRKPYIARKIRNKYYSENKKILNESKIILYKNKTSDEENKIIWNNLNYLIILFGVSIFLIFVILFFCYYRKKKKFKNVKNNYFEKMTLNNREANISKNFEENPLNIIKILIKK